MTCASEGAGPVLCQLRFVPAWLEPVPARLIYLRQPDRVSSLFDRRKQANESDGEGRVNAPTAARDFKETEMRSLHVTFMKVIGCTFKCLSSGAPSTKFAPFRNGLCGRCWPAPWMSELSEVRILTFRFSGKELC